MKAFIAVLLVASVAAGPLDLLYKEKSLMNQKFGKFGGIRGLPLTTGEIDIEHVNLPVERFGDVKLNNVYTIEELYNTELFSEYMNIPLFRQYMQYTIFQKYVASPLFQQFFLSTRQFQQYFRNPVLFYKYIYPQIQALKIQLEVRGVDSEFVRPIDNMNVNIYDYFRGIQGMNKNRFVDTVEHRALPFTTGYPTTTDFVGQRFDVNNVNYKYLLEKIYRDLLLNKTPMTEVYTEKFLPKNVEGQIVDQIIGEPRINFDNIKIVDGKIVHVPEIFQRFPVDKIVKDEIKGEIIKEELKKDLVKDTLYKDALIKDTLFKTDLVKDTLYKDQLVKDELVKEELIKKMYLNKAFPMTEEYEILHRNTPAGMFKINGEQELMYPTMFNTQRFGKNMLLKKLLLKKYLGEKVIPTMYNRDLLTQQKEFLPFTQEKIVTPTMYNRDLLTQQKEFLPFGEEKIDMYNPMYNTMLKEAKDMYFTEVPKTFEGKMMYNNMPMTTFETLNKEIKY